MENLKDEFTERWYRWNFLPDYKDYALWPMVRNLQQTIRYSGLGMGIANVLSPNWEE